MNVIHPCEDHQQHYQIQQRGHRIAGELNRAARELHVIIEIPVTVVLTVVLTVVHYWIWMALWMGCGCGF